MIKFKHKGDFKNTERFFAKSLHMNQQVLQKYGQEGVRALEASTPIDSGETARSWYYNIIKTNSGYKLEFANSHVVDGAKIVILIQYGHATRNGGFVQGRDFINPAIQPVFDKITEDLWREVTK